MFFQNFLYKKIIFLTVMGFCSFTFTETIAIIDDNYAEVIASVDYYSLSPEINGGVDYADAPEYIPSSVAVLFGREGYAVNEEDYCGEGRNMYCWYDVENAEQCSSNISGIDVLKIISQSIEQTPLFCLDLHRQTTSGKTCSWEDNNDSECWTPVEYEEDCASLAMLRLSSTFEHAPTICFKGANRKIISPPIQHDNIKTIDPEWVENPYVKNRKSLRLRPAIEYTSVNPEDLLDPTNK